MSDQNIIVAIIAIFSLTLLLLGFVIYFVLRYNQKQQEHIRDRALEKEKYDKAILSAQIEISEQTLQSIAQEIHDNVGQRLTLAILYLNSTEDWAENRRTEVVDVITTSLNDLRNLSRNLSGSFILHQGIEAALEREAQLISSSGASQCSLIIEGDEPSLSEQEQIILFRCVQEAISNAIRHGLANAISISFVNTENGVSLTVSDNGSGFDAKAVSPGLGLSNIEQRMALIGGKMKLESTPKGTMVSLSLPKSI